MTTDQMNETIFKYITTSTLKNAVLINGPWGSGKTYYVTSILKPYLEKQTNQVGTKFVVVTISLYGVESLQDISKEIFNRLKFGNLIKPHQFSSGKTIGSKARKKYFWETTKGTTAALAKSLLTKYTGIEITPPKTNEYWDYIGEDEVILILDDLERSRIDTVELLGYVNDFVENYSIKTILVGNEEEIARLFNKQELISKYELVKDLCLPNKNTSIQELINSSLNTSAKKPTFDSGIITTDAETLNSQVNYLFHEPAEYEIIKEKLISFTLTFEPDLQNIFLLISGATKNSLIPEERDGVLDKDSIIKVSDLFAKRGCENIRTFEFGLEMFRGISPLIKAKKLINKKEIVDLVVESFFRLAIENKDIRLKQNDVFSALDYRDTKLKMNSDNILRSEVERYISTSVMDAMKFESILDKLDNEITKNKANIESALSELNTRWIDKEDNDLKERMNRTIKTVLANPININAYENLIIYMHFYNDIFHDEQKSINYVLKKMLGKIRTNKTLIDDDDNFIKPGIDFREKSTIQSINNQFDLLKAEVALNKKTILSNLGKKQNSCIDEMAEKLKDNDLFENLGEKKSIISLIDLDTLLLEINSCSIEKLNKFFYEVLHRVYKPSNFGSYFFNDMPTIVNLIKSLSELKEELSKKKNKHVFVYVLGQIIDFLSSSVLPELSRHYSI